MATKDKKKSSRSKAQGNRLEKGSPSSLSTRQKKEIVTKVIRKIQEL